ncbi:MAG: hypothetical protein COV67_01855 [Nitrospinae bacterium CG11_big_fil_rev_8_21_14_0_20_56_8]|nr:MAG: hypothetical protein COV67_01855 [Nitrospinae bacterium CG11_big_fil_rev_8_21_14_0_20_56_8]
MPSRISGLLAMDFSVTCGTVTRPFRVGCLNWTWVPFLAARYQPAFFKRPITSRLSIPISIYECVYFDQP